MSEYAPDDEPAFIDPGEDPDPEAEADLQQDPVEDGGLEPNADADDADLLEQATPVSGDDEDYPNDLEVEPDV